MARVIWNGKVVADSKDCIIEKGGYYFLAADVDDACLQSSGVEGQNAFKGRTIFYDVVVDGHARKLGAWSYESTTSATKHLAGRIGFKYGLIDGNTLADSASCRVY